ncbi:GNAT family N-acetyltransferase [Oculatella sp. FACHB-28]|uniref:GNAT family N-acetyltransferase n=1 Tax=Cyanophyceae TaxID=3028117 RepID=UPI00168A1A82|nr:MULTISPECIES: GNAT family N-acetyltransferase [Cyanophyceae]MBD2058547.1 GNAT family N-acetyltransferase [Oculatella sp. FACHB-28]MBD2066565.1 GNAT family N-acetyltransferase [Leptolyngbya sp. FACHB-671]
MKLNHFQAADRFYERVKDHLEQHTAQHCMLLRACYALLHNPQPRARPPYLATVEAEDILAVAVWISPRYLILSQVRDFAALDLIAQDLSTHQEPLPGVSSLPDIATAFAQKWQALTQQSYKLSLKLWANQLVQVQSIPQASGYLQLAEEGDRSLLINWLKAFDIEALGQIENNAEASVDRALAQKTLYLWHDGVPVSMAGGRKSLPNGGWISPVYTPPEYRRKGYASSCVAALSQRLLDQGCDYCMLFTDQTNSTSNHVYQAIGYQPVCDWYDYSFYQ